MTRPSLIPGGVTVEGELSGKGDLVILGRVLGDIDIDGLLIIEEGGAVRGQVRAGSVVVRGALAGDAIGQESVRVEGSAQVVGDLRAPRVKVAEGARVKGRIQMGADAGLAHRSVTQSPVVTASPLMLPALGPRVRRARQLAAPSEESISVSEPRVSPAIVSAAPRPVFARPPLTMPRLARVAAQRR